MKRLRQRPSPNEKEKAALKFRAAEEREEAGLIAP
jgi:hypothetical protein